MKFSQLAFLALVMFMIACKGNPKETLTKKWKVDAATFKTMIKEDIEKLKKDSPDKAKDIESSLPLMEGFIGGITVDFKADGTAETTTMGQTTKGKWTLSEDGKKITIDENGNKNEIEVLELSKGKLVLKSEKDKMRIPLVPAN
ncbi:MAG: hypothetical protein MUC49_08295 [Raineya sp.]|jgi:hypothetical protein|nr:hypothetical protein [Raineya sp.]